ncbi:hypothetical protein HanIR_Chr05g0225531 [Helianthus annuus]|nr:hypothetical protein HanIR_Chr05g0225531 [Helianthus annuus]
MNSYGSPLSCVSPIGSFKFGSVRQIPVLIWLFERIKKIFDLGFKKSNCFDLGLCCFLENN